MQEEHSYAGQYRRRMDTYALGLADHLDMVPTLEPMARDAAMRYLLELTCQAQHVRNIVLGRAALLGLPRDWLLANIERYAERVLPSREWEYRRLGEIYERLDEDLLRRLVMRGIVSDDVNIREAARDFRERLARAH